MSFSNKIKNESTKIETNNTEAVAQCSAILRNAATINEKITLTTETASIARNVFNLIKEIFNITPQIKTRQTFNFTEKYIYNVIINKEIPKIIDVLSLKDVPEDYIVEDESQKMAYMRGLFLSCGSINDPKTSRYHLEFTVNSELYAKYLQKLLNEFNLNAKTIKREKNYMIYIKEAEKIGDFLRIIGTPLALFYFEDIRIYRDHKNTVNRLNNCDQANVERQIESANQQLKDIDIIKSHHTFDKLDDKLKEAATYREKYPDVSLQELSEIITIETTRDISKSGLYHRFNKLKKIAIKIKGE